MTSSHKMSQAQKGREKSFLRVTDRGRQSQGGTVRETEMEYKTEA